MEVLLQDVLFKLVIGVPFGLGGVFLLIKGLKKANQFFFFDYQGNIKARFRDNLKSNLYLASGSVCLLMVIFAVSASVREAATVVAFLPIALCLGAFIIPIGVAGLYWRSYWTEKMYGGFMPTVRVAKGYDQPGVGSQPKMDLSKVKVPRKVIVSAATIALVIFLGLILLASNAQWNGPSWLGILLLFLLPGLFSFGIFMAITSTSLSRRIERMRNGELVDEE